MVKKVSPLLLVILFSTLSVLPLFHRGFPPTHDGEYHVIRFYEFYRGLSSGVVYPRWAPDLNFGYGAPLFNYVYPLPNYVAAFFHSLGFSFTDAFKYNLVTATIIGAVFMYFFTKEIFDSTSGVVAAVFFSFGPYHLVDVYVRGSVGEVWSLAIVPGLLWALFLLIRTGNVKYVSPVALLFALLIFSHNILIILFFPLVFSFAAILCMQDEQPLSSARNPFLAVLLGIGLASVFWLPAISEKAFVKGLEVYDYTSNFPDAASLLLPSWGTGFAGQAGGNAMSTQVGVANLLTVISSLALIKMYKKRKLLFFPIFFIGWFFIVMFFMLPYSSFLWRTIPFFNYVQFPWRYLSVIIIVCSVLAGGLLAATKRKVLVAGLLIAISIGTTFSYANFAYYHPRDDAYYTTRSNFIDGTNSPGNAFNTIFLHSRLSRSERKASFQLGEGTIVSERLLPERQSYHINTASPSWILLHTLYFPGWEATDNGKVIPLSKTEGGLMSMFLLPGEHSITVRFTDTIIRRVALSITVFSTVLLFMITVSTNKKHNESRS
ncbi:MAG: 6-pyruvoyl-tetrahydropterin synthase-related protein [bacterium]|nr:6-pyruvoyl-tetrahydropterin synthase-related protein [bacterium]